MKKGPIFTTDDSKAIGKGEEKSKEDFNGISSHAKSIHEDFV